MYVTSITRTGCSGLGLYISRTSSSVATGRIEVLDTRVLQGRESRDDDKEGLTGELERAFEDRKARDSGEIRQVLERGRLPLLLYIDQLE